MLFFHIIYYLKVEPIDVKQFGSAIDDNDSQFEKAESLIDVTLFESILNV